MFGMPSAVAVASGRRMSHERKQDLVGSPMFNLQGGSCGQRHRYLVRDIMNLYARLSMASPVCPAYVHRQPLRRSMAPCSPIMQTFNSALTHARVVHHPWALHGAIQRGWIQRSRPWLLGS